MDLSEKAHMVKTNLKIVQDYANYLFYAIAPIPMEFPLPKNIRARRALNKMNQLVFELIEEHKQHPDQYQDLLSAYLAAKDEDTGASMSEQLVRDEVMTLMLAGHDTTALSMSIAFEQIAKHPEIQAKLDEEFATLPGDSLTMADLKNLTYTNQVFSETMRLYPAAWAVGRELTQDLKYKDYEFTKGSTFIISQYLTHRHPKYWDRPDEFNPDRFSPEASKERHPFVYFPFGGGQRTCIGSNLAKLESQIIMPILLRRFRMESIQGYQYKIHPRISLVLDPGVRLKVTPR
jgi:cytochrome P450